MNWFEVKVKYVKTEESGKEKKVTEPYLIDALSFTEAEARISEELRPFMGEDFTIVNIKRANYSDIFTFENGDRWFKCRVHYTTVDEAKGVEKKIATTMLVQASDMDSALENITESMKNCLSDYTISVIQETPIMDVIPYFKGEEDEVPANLTPMAEVVPDGSFE